MSRVRAVVAWSAAIAGGVLAVSCSNAAPTPGVAVAGAAKPTQKQNGPVNVTKLYNDTCSHCHGEAGEGGGAGTDTFLLPAKFSQDLDRPYFDSIKNGVTNGAMDAYESTMSDETIWALVVHIRELQNAKFKADRIWPSPDKAGNVKTQLVNYRVETVVPNDLSVPWAVDWLPDGRMLVTNRVGRLSIANDKGVIGEVTGVPDTRSDGQGGLMALKLHPDYRKNGWVYLAFTDYLPDARRLTKIVRGKLQLNGNNATWTDQQTIFEADHEFYSLATFHFGTRIVFDSSHHVYFAVGERGTNEKSQDLKNPYGKIYRLNDDGSIPADNPYHGKGNKITDSIWTWGHRNPQGIAFDAEGNLWDTEHAPRGGDELNLLKKGEDYGWPFICFGINYNDSPFRLPWPREDQKYTMPVYRWLPSIATCGLTCVKNSKFTAWDHDLLAGGLASNRVDRIRVKDGKLVSIEPILWGIGRVRDVEMGPDGLVYVVLNGPDKIVRLVPN